MNRKGLIISTTLYGMFGITLITVTTILYVLASNRTTVDAMNEKVKMCIEECGTPQDICGVDNLTPQNKILNDNILNTKNIDTTKFAVSNEFYDNATEEEKAYLTKDENGLFADKDNDGTTFFFRGAVNNNYLKYGKDESGNDLLWRIVRINGDGTLRIILDDIIDYYLIDADGNKVKVKDGDYLSRIAVDSSLIGDKLGNAYSHWGYKIEDFFDRTFLNLTIIGNSVYRYYLSYDKVLYRDTNKNSTNYYVTIYPNYKFNFTTISLFSEYPTFYNNILENWFNNNIDINTTYVIDGKYCDTKYRASDYYNSYSLYTALKNIDFKCNNKLTYSLPGADNYAFENNNINLEIGLLSYGELLMSGYSKNSVIEGADTYLNIGKNFVLSTPYQNQDGEGGRRYENTKFYFGDNGKIGIQFVQDDYKVSEHETYENKIYSDNTFTKLIYIDKGSREKLYLRNLRPVINLSANIKLTGSGTIANPYQIVD